MLTTGMCFIVAAVAVAGWFFLRDAFDNTIGINIVVILLLGLAIAISLIVLLRPPVVLTLDPVGYRSRRDEGRWKDVQDVALEQGLLTFADSSSRTVSLPLNVIDSSRRSELVNEVYARLNAAHGYTRFTLSDDSDA